MPRPQRRSRASAAWRSGGTFTGGLDQSLVPFHICPARRKPYDHPAETGRCMGCVVEAIASRKALLRARRERRDELPVAAE